MIALEAAGLGKRYRDVWALREVFLSVPAGRVVALVGPNGAGKSTLLDLAVGLRRPTTGHLRVFGEAGQGVFEVVSDFAGREQEWELFREMVRQSGRPMSISIAHPPCISISSFRKSRNACRAPIPGRYPYDDGRKSCSYTAARTMLTAF